MLSRGSEARGSPGLCWQGSAARGSYESRAQNASVLGTRRSVQRRVRPRSRMGPHLRSLQSPGLAPTGRGRAGRDPAHASESLRRARAPIPRVSRAGLGSRGRSGGDRGTRDRGGANRQHRASANSHGRVPGEHSLRPWCGGASKSRLRSRDGPVGSAGDPPRRLPDLRARREGREQPGGAGCLPRARRARSGPRAPRVPLPSCPGGREGRTLSPGPRRERASATSLRVSRLGSRGAGPPGPLDGRGSSTRRGRRRTPGRERRAT